MIAGSLLLRLRRRKMTARPAPPVTRYAVLMPPGRTRIFAKVYTQDAENEFERGRVLFEAAQRTNHFFAPRPLTLVRAHQLIVWEYQDDLVESRDYLVASLRSSMPKGERLRLFLSAGKALATIHSALGSLPNRGSYYPIRSVRAPSAELNRHVMNTLATTPLVSPHWDFACGNLFLRAHAHNDPSLWVMDPMPNFYMMPEYFGATDFGSNVMSSPYVDAAQLLYSVRAHPRFSGWVADEHDGFLDAFLRGYREAGGLALDDAVVLACAAEITLMYQDLLDRSSSRRALSDRLDRRARLWSAQRLFADATARLRT